jgi:hypothetical protein
MYFLFLSPGTILNRTKQNYYQTCFQLKLFDNCILGMYTYICAPFTHSSISYCNLWLSYHLHTDYHEMENNIISRCAPHPNPLTSIQILKVLLDCNSMVHKHYYLAHQENSLLVWNLQLQKIITWPIPYCDFSSLWSKPSLLTSANKQHEVPSFPYWLVRMKDFGFIKFLNIFY